MTERKFTDDDVIKALECCAVDPNSGKFADCKNCPLDYSKTANCFEYEIQIIALAIINRQSAEIDDLTRDTIPKLKYGLERANKYGAELDREFAELKRKYDLAVAEREANVKALIEKTADAERLKAEKDNLIRTYAECQTENIKEFAEQVKQAFYYEFDEIIPSIMADKIDALVKEMTEGEQ